MKTLTTILTSVTMVFAMGAPATAEMIALTSKDGKQLQVVRAELCAKRGRVALAATDGTLHSVRVNRNGSVRVIGGAKYPKTCSAVRLASAGGGNGSQTGTGGTQTAQDVVDDVYGNTTTNDNVVAQDDTVVADAATGTGGQAAGDEVPTQSVTQDQLGGQEVEDTSEAGEADSGVTDNGNEAPGFD